MSARRHADRSPQLLAYTAVTIVLGLTAVGWSIATFPIDPAISLTAHGDREGLLLGVVFWIGLALFGGTRVHRLHGHGTLTFHLPFIVAAMALGGPTAGALVALLGTIERRELEGEMPWYGAVSNHAHLALGAVVGGVVLLGSEAALRASLGDGPEVVLASLVIGSLVFGVVAAGLAEGTIILRDRLTLHEATRYFNTTFRLTAAAEVVVGWILVLTYTSVGWWAALITAGLVLVIWQGYDAGERARHDPLTGLLSRAGYDVRVEEAVRAAERNARGFAAIAFDLDGFGAINNKHGHAVGDDVIREVEARIHAEIRLTDAGVRLGGDDTGSSSPMSRCGRREIGGPPVLRRVTAPMTVGGRSLRVGASLGALIVESEAEVPRLAEIHRMTDHLMYLVKYSTAAAVGGGASP